MPPAPGDRPAAPHEGRILAFDLARGLAVAFMVLVHVLGHYGTAAAWATPLGTAVTFLGGPPAAPVFMFLMGTSLAFSRRATPRGILRRAAWLAFLAYLLNVLRGWLPATLGLTTGVVTPEQLAPYTPSALLFMVDIHQMASLALVVLAALTAVRAGPLVALGLVAVVAVVSPLLWGRTVGHPLVDGGLALLWGDAWNVFFPLLPWVAYPLAGMAYGRLLVRSGQRIRFMRGAAVAGLAVGGVGLALMATVDPFTGVDDYWRQGPGPLLGMLGFIPVWLLACDLVVRRVPAAPVYRVLFGWSTRVTAMYCVHWILLAWGVGLVGRNALDLPGLAVASVVLLVLTDRITRLHPAMRGPAPRGEAPPRVAVVAP